MSRTVPDLSSDFDAHQFIGDYGLGLRPHRLFLCWPFGINFPCEVIDEVLSRGNASATPPPRGLLVAVAPEKVAIRLRKR
jgi:hypothetical protein